MTVNLNKIAGYAILTVVVLQSLFLLYFMWELALVGTDFWVGLALVAGIGCPLPWILTKKAARQK